MHLFDHSFLVKHTDSGVEVCLFEHGVVSSDAEPDHCYFQTDAGWVDEHGERPDADMLADLDAVLLPVEGNNTPLYGMNPSPLTGIPDGETQFVLEDPLALDGPATLDHNHEHGPGTHEH